MNEHYVITIKADNRPGLVHLITGMINRKLIDIESLNAAKTDISSIVLITIELNVSEKALTPLLLKLENIIEVYAAEALKVDKVICHRSAFFKMSRSFLETPNALVLQKYGAAIVNLYKDAILICKSGSEAELQNFYNQLEGSHLLGFSQTGLISESKLIENSDEWRISKLAA